MSQCACFSASQRTVRTFGSDGELRFERDDSDRPKLKIVTGDWDAGDGFAAVVARHGADAIEYENISRAKAHAERARSEGERGER